MNKIKLLTKEEIKKYLSQLRSKWIVVDNKKIKHEFLFGDFKQAISFVNKIARITEKENHHPDIHVFYSRVVLELGTHEAGGLSEKDFFMASKIERLFYSRSITKSQTTTTPIKSSAD